MDGLNLLFLQYIAAESDSPMIPAAVDSWGKREKAYSPEKSFPLTRGKFIPPVSSGEDPGDQTSCVQAPIEEAVTCGYRDSRLKMNVLFFVIHVGNLGGLMSL